MINSILHGSKIEQIPIAADSIRIINLGDVHRGNPAFNEELWKAAIKFVKDNDDVFWVSTGDLFECAVAGGRHFDAEALSIEAERQLLQKELQPIANMCLGIVASNHSVRVKKACGLDLDQSFCDSLHVPYLGDIGLLNITVGRNCYYVVMHHGHGGRRPLDDLYHGADLYLDGHTHKYEVHYPQYNTIDRKRSKVRVINSLHVTTAHCIDWYSSYAAQAKYPPSTPGFALITLKGGETKDMQATLWQG